MSFLKYIIEAYGVKCVRYPFITNKPKEQLNFNN